MTTKIKVGGVEFNVTNVSDAKNLFAARLNTEVAADPSWSMGFISEVARVFKDLNEDSQRLSKVRAACGYVEDGSQTCVSISQDDATKTWCVAVGNKGPHAFDESFFGAIDKLEIQDDQT